MSDFFYVQFELSPKSIFARCTGNERIAIELPRKHVTDWKLERPHLKLSDEDVAVELAQVVAIATAKRSVPLTHSPLMQREIHSATFLPERLPIMNERGCDYEDNGIRSWFIHLL